MISENQKQITKCRGCGADIVWLKTSSGKNIPVNYKKDVDFKIFDPKNHEAHFSTCPQAKEFRREKKQ